MRNIIYSVVLLIAVTGCQNGNQESESNELQTVEVQAVQSEKAKLADMEDGEIKNIILFIGDGTGLAQIASGQLYVAGPDGSLHMQTMPVTGLVKTHSSSSLITDSAAGATAYSCGAKTYNGAIAVIEDGTPCKTILELAEEKGLSTGLVATSSITHATPASFASHVPDRNMHQEIAADMLDSGAEVLFGGGYNFFVGAENDTNSLREDDRDLIIEYQEAGYEVVTTGEQMNESNAQKLLGLFNGNAMIRESSEPNIQAMTQKALDILSADDDGFFLMVEGSQIDWGGHANESDYMLEEFVDFDEAIGLALEFAKKNGNTLVLVTADHETGGLALVQSNEDNSTIQVQWATDYHTAIPVPLMAYGPHAMEFTGWVDNTYVGLKMAELLGFDSLPIIMVQ